MKHKLIESPQNPLIKKVLNIKNRRSRYNAFIIEGPKLIEMALNAGADLRQVFFTGDFKDSGILGQVGKISSEMFEIKETLLKKLADTESPQGILAIASYKPQRLKDLTFKDSPFLVISDGIQEPGNLGSLIRTADAAGADALILLQGTCDAFMPKTLRASAGSIFNIPLVYSHRKDLIEWASGSNIKIAVTSADARQSIYDADLNTAIAFVFGNESRGVSPELKKAMNLNLRIPIYGKAESLNVSISAGICLYEAVRQRGAVPTRSLQ